MNNSIPVRKQNDCIERAKGIFDINMEERPHLNWREPTSAFGVVGLRYELGGKGLRLDILFEEGEILDSGPREPGGVGTDLGFILLSRKSGRLAF